MQALGDSKILVSLSGENGLGAEFLCPLCRNVILDAYVSVRCLHRYCRDCISEWSETHHRVKVPCPSCHVPFHKAWDLKQDKKFDAIVTLWHRAIPLGDRTSGVKTRQALLHRHRPKETKRERYRFKRAIDRPLPKPEASGPFHGSSSKTFRFQFRLKV